MVCYARVTADDKHEMNGNRQSVRMRWYDALAFALRLKSKTTTSNTKKIRTDGKTWKKNNIKVDLQFYAVYKIKLNHSACVQWGVWTVDVVT